MNRRIIFISISLILAIGLAASACAQPTPTPAPSPSPAPAPAPEPTAEVFELSFSSPWPEPSPNHQRQYKPILDEIEQKSNGRIKITTFLAGALGKNNEQYDIARTGKADMVTISTGYTPGRFPMTEIMTVPLAFPTTVDAQDALLGIADRILYNDFPDTHVLTYYQSQVFFLYTNKEVKKLEDLAGLKIRSSGATITKSVEALGATPVSMGLPDLYLSLQTGVVDAGILGPSGLLSFKLQEVVSHEVKINLGHTVQIITMNTDTWESLPQDLQQIITDAARKAGEYEVGLFINDEVPVSKLIVDRGGTSTTLAPDEEQRWIEALTPVFTDYVEELKSQGLPADELVDIIREESAKHNVPFPF